MHASDVVGDPVRRRILELAISQPAVAQHLKMLRGNGFAQVRADGARRLYALVTERGARAAPTPPRGRQRPADGATTENRE
ncbi:hypothetical protein GCM10023147_29520 [Tsukamurella soli]|uniref:Regulatory protein, arsR family n=1 Tax=Tsukamurella soli TaxID=644556 RepID=A0ABP8JTR6_9ACTN